MVGSIHWWIYNQLDIRDVIESLGQGLAGSAQREYVIRGMLWSGLSLTLSPFLSPSLPPLLSSLVMSRQTSLHVPLCDVLSASWFRNNRTKSQTQKPLTTGAKQGFPLLSQLPQSGISSQPWQVTEVVRKQVHSHQDGDNREPEAQVSLIDTVCEEEIRCGEDLAFLNT